MGWALYGAVFVARMAALIVEPSLRPRGVDLFFVPYDPLGSLAAMFLIATLPCNCWCQRGEPRLPLGAAVGGQSIAKQLQQVQPSECVGIPSTPSGRIGPLQGPGDSRDRIVSTGVWLSRRG